MSYSYDRRKVAAKLDVHDKWRGIVEKHRKAEGQDFADLLKEMVNYLKSEGLDLDLKRSYLDKYHAGSDGVRMEGLLVVSERPENTIEANAKSIQKWVHAATGLWGGGVQRIGEGPAKRQVDDKPVGVWTIDVGSY